MLWLAGMMGLMAVGSVAVLGLEPPEEREEPDYPPDARADGVIGTTSISAFLENAVGSDDTRDAPGMIFVGGDDNDMIEAAVGNDQIGGYGGDDILFGGLGSDDLHGAEGRDLIHGDDGDDTLHGEDDDDLLYGDAGDDSLFGHNGYDLLYGGDGQDTLQGSDGNDTLFGDAGDDALMGGLQDDHVHGGFGMDLLLGGWGDDTLNGIVGDPGTPGIKDLDGADYLNGGGGDDLILTGQDDTVTTGHGDDVVVLGDWIAQGHSAKVSDFDAQDDTLMMIWDDNTHAEPPTLTLRADDSDSNTMHILLNGAETATVKGGRGLTAADVVMISLSNAQVAGFAPT